MTERLTTATVRTRVLDLTEGSRFRRHPSRRGRSAIPRRPCASWPQGSSWRRRPVEVPQGSSVEGPAHGT